MNDIFFPQKTGSCSSSGTDWALSIRWISILWISIRKTNCTIHWMKIYPVVESCSVVTRTHLGNAIGWNPTYQPETAWLKFAKFAVNRDFHKRVFRSRGQHLRKFIRTEESVLFTKEKSLTPTGFGTWPPFHWFGTPIWPRRSLVKTLLKFLYCLCEIKEVSILILMTWIAFESDFLYEGPEALRASIHVKSDTED